MTVLCAISLLWPSFSFCLLTDRFNLEMRNPCVVFTSHPSLRFGDAVHFMELWGNSSANAVIFTGNYLQYAMHCISVLNCMKCLSWIQMYFMFFMMRLLILINHLEQTLKVTFRKFSDCRRRIINIELTNDNLKKNVGLLQIHFNVSVVWLNKTNALRDVDPRRVTFNAVWHVRIKFTLLYSFLLL